MTHRRIITTRLAVATTLLALHGCRADGFEEDLGLDCISPELDELPFAHGTTERLVVGRHRTTLAWRGPGASTLPQEDQTEDFALEVRKTGELKWGVHCGGYERFDVEVEVEISKGRHATFKGEARGVKEGAQIWGRAAVAVAEALSVPGPAVVGRGQPDYQLYTWIDADGARGSLSSQSDTAAECERARWPVDRACADASDRQMPFDTTFGDFDFSQVLKDLEQLQSQELRWSKNESTTDLELTFERGEAPICVGIERSEETDASYRGRTLETRATAHVKTSDARIDVDIPVTLSVQWSKKSGLVAIPGDGRFTIDHTLTISGDVSRAGSQLFDSANEAGDDSDTFQRLGLYVTAGRKAVQGNLYLAIARPDWSKPQIALSNAREQMSLDGVCIEGASRDEDIDHGAFGPLDAIR